MFLPFLRPPRLLALALEALFLCALAKSEEPAPRPPPRKGWRDEPAEPWSTLCILAGGSSAEGKSDVRLGDADCLTGLVCWA